MTVDEIRSSLGRMGVWTSLFTVADLGAVREALARIEELGYGTVWSGELPVGREAMTAAATLLAESKRLTVGLGIANIWVRDGVAAANAARTLNESFGNRFVLGLGVSHPPVVAMRGGGATYDKPLTAMRGYLEAMAAADERAGGDRPPLVLAALAPRMLELARDHTDGTFTYFVPVEHTAVAREALGPDKIVAVEQAVILETDAAKAREIARRHTTFYLGAPNYRNNLLRLGWPEDELDDGGSDAVVDRLVVWGDVDAVHERVAAHFAAGADHVALQVLDEASRGFEPSPFPLDALAALA